MVLLLLHAVTPCLAAWMLACFFYFGTSILHVHLCCTFFVYTLYVCIHFPRLTRVERERIEHKKKLLALATEHEQVLCMNKIHVALYYCRVLQYVCNVYWLLIFYVTLPYMYIYIWTLHLYVYICTYKLVTCWWAEWAHLVIPTSRFFYTYT